MLEQDLLLTLYTEVQSWRKVAARLGKFSDAYWSLLAAGRREWSLEHRNLVRAAFGLPLLDPPASEIIAQEDIERVFKLTEKPDAAALFSIGDATLVSARFQVDPDGFRDDASFDATHCSIVKAKRTRANPSVIVTMEKIALLPPSAFSTRRGKTGNLAAIAAAAQRAAAELGGVR